MNINRNFKFFFLYPNRLSTHFGGQITEEGQKNVLGSTFFHTFFPVFACLSHFFIQ